MHFTKIMSSNVFLFDISAQQNIKQSIIDFEKRKAI